VRDTPVAPVRPSTSGKEKKAKAHSASGFPLQAFRGLLKSLATLSRLPISLGDKGPTYTRCAKPTPLQAEALKRLGLALP
jgi:hypothetical protein